MFHTQTHATHSRNTQAPQVCQSIACPSRVYLRMPIAHCVRSDPIPTVAGSFSETFKRNGFNNTLLCIGDQPSATNQGGNQGGNQAGNQVTISW